MEADGQRVEGAGGPLGRRAPASGADPGRPGAGDRLVSMDQSSPRRYAAIPSRETCAARERRDLVDRVYDGSAGQLVAAFVKDGSLSPQEREELRRLLDEMEV